MIIIVPNSGVVQRLKWISTCIMLPGLLKQITTNWVVENNRNLVFHTSGGQKSKIIVSAEPCPCSFWSLWGDFILASSSLWCLHVFLGLWLHHSNHCLCVHMVFSLLLSLIKTPVIGFRACLGNPGWYHVQILNLVTSAKFLLPYKVTIHRFQR